MGSSSSTIPVERKTNKPHKNANIINTLGQVATSIDIDRSVPNIIINMARIHQQVDLNHITECIQQLEECWLRIWKYESNLKKSIGIARWNRLEKLKSDYESLVLKTDIVIKLFMVGCKIQKTNIQDLLFIIEESQKKKNNFELSHSEFVFYEDCIGTLTKWIQQEELVELIKDWGTIIDRAKQQISDWKKLAKKSKKGFWCLVIGTLGTISILVGCLLAVFFYSANAPIVVEQAAAAIPGAVSNASAATSSLIGYIASGSLITVGAVAAIGAKMCIDKTYSYAVMKAANNTHNEIRKMMKTSLIIKTQINNLHGDARSVGVHIRILKGHKSFQKMKSGLKAINKVLKDYQNKGKKIRKKIKEIELNRINSI